MLLWILALSVSEVESEISEPLSLCVSKESKLTCLFLGFLDSSGIIFFSTFLVVSYSLVRGFFCFLLFFVLFLGATFLFSFSSSEVRLSKLSENEMDSVSLSFCSCSSASFLAIFLIAPGPG